MAGELPIGWEKKIEKDTGKILFIDHENQRTTFTDPRLAFAIEEVPHTVGDVRQRFDASSNALQILHGRDLTGKLAVITGANCGIGYETAKSLAFHGCEVIMGCRNKASAEEAIAKIGLEKPAAGTKCRFMKLDLTTLQTTKDFTDQLKSEIK